jgi:hypothetical protein
MHMETIRASDIEPKSPPKCPSCNRPMHYYGGTAGFICCEYKILTRLDGWFDEKGLQ